MPNEIHSLFTQFNLFPQLELPRRFEYYGEQPISTLFSRINLDSNELKGYVAQPFPLLIKLYPEETDIDVNDPLYKFPKDCETININLDRAAIMINNECYLFRIPKIATNNHPYHFHELCAYFPRIDAMYTGGASECAILTAYSNHPVSILIMAHVVSANDLTLIKEKLWNTLLVLLNQRELFKNSLPDIHFKLFATTPDSLAAFDTMSSVSSIHTFSSDIVSREQVPDFNEYMGDDSVEEEEIDMEGAQDFVNVHICAEGVSYNTDFDGNVRREENNNIRPMQP